VLPPGVSRIAVPTGLPVGDVNAYLLKRDPVTLVDPGPLTEPAWEALKAGLSEAGVGRFEVAQILVTHGHVDHFGLAARLRKEAGAKVLAPAGDLDMIADFHATYALRRERFQAVLEENGAPGAMRAQLAAFFARLDALGEPVPVDVPLLDGDTFLAGGELFTTLHVPGHSKGASAFLGSRGLLLTGDTAIRGITPIAAFGGRDGVSVGLEDQLRSVDRLSTLPVREVLPGHRDRLPDLRLYAWEIRAQFDSRQRSVLAALDHERTAWEVASSLFGELGPAEAFLGITEALGHLEVLESRGAVRVADADGVRRFRRA